MHAMSEPSKSPCWQQITGSNELVYKLSAHAKDGIKHAIASIEL